MVCERLIILLQNYNECTREGFEYVANIVNIHFKIVETYFKIVQTAHIQYYRYVLFYNFAAENQTNKTTTNN